MYLKTRLTATIVPPAEDITDSAEITAVKSSCTNQFHMNSPENHRSWTKRRKRKLLRLKCVFVYKLTRLISLTKVRRNACHFRCYTHP